MARLESVEPKEAEQIDAIVKSTEKQLRRRYAKAPRFLRGVHPKDHGCVRATFTVLKDLPPEYRVGVFADPGRRFQAEIRFSNAAAVVEADSALDKERVVHGSRGMAVKLHGVGGARLVPDDGEDTQDFLMINQPVFAFANTADYRILSEAIEDDDRNILAFFKAMFTNADPAVQKRAAATKQIIERIGSNSMAPEPLPATPPPLPAYAFQVPPLSPFDNRYFSAAPFLFGDGQVAKFGATPVAPERGDLGKDLGDYLQAALKKRLSAGQDIAFEFQVQKRPAEGLDVDVDIENACSLWDESKHSFLTVATITIPPQDVDARKEECEKLVFSPWHGLVEHRPLGSINRLRRAVYEKSAALRGCPVRAEGGSG
jgi:hypothetical protein